MRDFERDPAKLSAKQQRALAALLEQPTTRAAALAANVSEATIWRWLADPVFDTEYRRARSQLLETTLTALQSASVRAVETLRDVLDDAAAKPSERVSAARAVLEFSLKAHDTLAVEARLRDLEQRLAATEERGHGKLKSV